MEGRLEIVGRRRELAALTRLLEGERSGLRALVLTGAAGAGKTALWRHGVERASEAGFRILTARPASAEARLSHAGLSDLLAGVDQEPFAALPRVQRRAVEAALLRRGVLERPVEARAVATALLTVLRSLAATAPVLIGVDDAQWLDTPTAAALSFAVRRLEHAPVAVLATLRVEDDRRAAIFTDAIASERREESPLGPLSVASLHAILRSELDWAPPRPALVKIGAASAGNPFDAVEIARELLRIGGVSPSEPLPVPAHARDLLRGRIERLPARTRAALLEAACLAAPRTGPVADRPLAPAEEAGIVRVAADGRIEFSHPLLAAAVYESAPAAQRRAAHRRLAGRVMDAEERARHLALGASGPDARAARALDAAAAHA
ncbi:MAG: AAA family ATPase, partial [Gaiellaceae bacterium]